MIKIVVDCEENDPVDINAGGPMWLGFDFYINDTDNVKEYKSFIKEELKKLPDKPGVYIMRDKDDNILYVIHSFNSEVTTKAWSKEMIANCIKKGY